MTSWAHTSYLVRYLKQIGYIKQRKIHNGKVHRHKKSFFIPIGLHSVTISEVIDYNQYKHFHQKKVKKKKIEGKGERENVKRREKEKKRAEEGGKKGSKRKGKSRGRRQRERRKKGKRWKRGEE